jgi:enoyl-CoA hydratase
MEMNLTGIPMDAHEAEKRGLVSKVVPAASLLEETVKTAEVIAGNSHLINQVKKLSEVQFLKSKLMYFFG